MKTLYRKMEIAELDRSLFAHFERRQDVTKCWRKVDGQWVIRDHPFVDQWGEEEYKILVKCLRHTLETKGVVFGAFREGKLKGFASVEGGFLGEKKEYKDLTCIHVSRDVRGCGIGRELFVRAAGWAREQGAEKLYISAHSAVETQAFYRNMGCVEAVDYSREHVEREPYDCQLELAL